MSELGHRMEFLATDEHDELLALVSFLERRLEEKLKAKIALHRLGKYAPQLVKSS